MYAKVDCYKGDFDNHRYALKNCEITLYTKKNGIYKIAKDLNGNNCVGLTNSHGRLSFNVQGTDLDTDGSIKYYAEETKAPWGYKKLNGKFIVRPTTKYYDPIVTRMPLIMFDTIIIMPPKTGTPTTGVTRSSLTIWNELLLNPYTGNPVAEIWWNHSCPDDRSHDTIHWWFFDETGHATTESDTYLPGHIKHIEPNMPVLVTDVELTFIDRNDNVTRTVPAGSQLPMNYIDIFSI